MTARVRLLIAVLLLAAAASFVIATIVGSNETGDGSATSEGGIERRIPGDGDEVLQQQPVGIDLAPSYELTSLVIHPNRQLSDGVEVLSEVQHSTGLNQYLFSPGSGRLIESLSADTNCVVASFVLIARRDEVSTVAWCFEVS